MKKEQDQQEEVLENEEYEPGENQERLEEEDLKVESGEEEVKKRKENGGIGGAGRWGGKADKRKEV